MDFIEQWLGISPDGGNGTLEVACVAAALVGILALVGRHWMARVRR
jgi:hypothetical protein